MPMGRRNNSVTTVQHLGRADEAGVRIANEARSARQGAARQGAIPRTAAQAIRPPLRQRSSCASDSVNRSLRLRAGLRVHGKAVAEAALRKEAGSRSAVCPRTRITISARLRFHRDRLLRWLVLQRSSSNPAVAGRKEGAMGEIESEVIEEKEEEVVVVVIGEAEAVAAAGEERNIAPCPAMLPRRGARVLLNLHGSIHSDSDRDHDGDSREGIGYVR